MSMPARRISSHVDLQQLLEGYADAPAIAITGISSDSRHARRGEVFFALQGEASHGLDYLQQVLAEGVAAIVWDPQTHYLDAADCDVPLIPVVGLDLVLGEISNRWFDTPSAAMNVAAVTGTNGKTTVAWLIARCLQELERKCAYVGTLGAGIETLHPDSGLTTPPCIELHTLLADFRQLGALATALEVSSHALVQNRVSGVHFDAALFTNLSRDHIDYHGDMHSYGEAKAQLFLEDDVPHRIICTDSEFGQTLAERCDGDVVTVSTTRQEVTTAGPSLKVTRIEATAQGSQVAFESSWGNAEFEIRMPGDFNVANASLVIALLLRWGIELNDACDAMSKVAAPPGRLQRVEHATAPATFVDFAHTPAGLEVALQALRPHCRGNLWCVFGCGGDRDRGKRKLMGAAVSQHADHAVVTNDNPRSENPSAIISEVLRGMNKGAVAVDDRAAAIAYAISRAAEDDVVLIAGKGHEDYQIIGDKRLPFSDYLAAFTNLEARQSGGAQRK
jgi:UDP-N-acetylmuramoyl-L-alanyl-D-glutamate--2,6-diaminopimelate ligase